MSRRSFTAHVARRASAPVNSVTDKLNAQTPPTKPTAVSDHHRTDTSHHNNNLSSFDVEHWRLTLRPSPLIFIPRFLSHRSRLVRCFVFINHVLLCLPFAFLSHIFPCSAFFSRIPDRTWSEKCYFLLCSLLIKLPFFLLNSFFMFETLLRNLWQFSCLSSVTYSRLLSQEPQNIPKSVKFEVSGPTRMTHSTYLGEI